MKNSLFHFFIIFILSLTINNSYAQNGGPSDSTKWPTFTMTANNIQIQSGPNGQDSIILFDVYLLHTNYGQPGIDPFEFCCAQYAWYFNREIWQNPSIGGNLVLTNLGDETVLPAGLRPVSFQVDSVNYYGPNTNLLQTSGNLPNSSINFFISHEHPGTKILKMKLTTSAKSFRISWFNQLDLVWKTGSPSPNTFLAYFTPNPPGPDSANPQWAQPIYSDQPPKYIYQVLDNVYPVELTGFTFFVKKNNVELSWSTATETNNQMFEIERSVANFNSNEWTKVGTVEGKGTTTEIRNYKFNDRGVESGHYSYRLKQIDFNGTANYHELSDEVIVGVPTAYAISQNYPNPFNPTTRIEYELPYDGKVSILLYDISGREVAKLVNEVKTAGYYTFQFNGANLSSGMYFYIINAEGSEQRFVSTKKMVLIK